MKHKNPSQKMNGILLVITRFYKLAVLGICFLLLISASAENSQVSRGEFVAMIAKSQPDHPFLPKNHASLSQEELFSKTARVLKIRGFNVLSKKNGKGMLTQQEFVRLSYALSGEPPGRNLFEQKLFLKKNGVVRSADVGIATGAEGKILQFHEGEKRSEEVKLASPVFMNDRIKTKSDAEATFTFDDKSSLTIGEKSNVSIKKHIYDPDKDLRQTVVHVALGTVRFVVTKGKAKGSSFKVVTPTAVAGVRGTEFVVVVDKVGKTSFIGISGSIETAPLLANGTLGQKSIVAKGQIQEIAKGAIKAEVKSNNGKAFGKNKDKGNKGKGKGRNKFREKGVNKGKAEKTTKSKFMTKAEVEKPREKPNKVRLASISGKDIAKKTAKDTAQNVAKKTAKDTAKKAAKDTAKKIAKNTAKKTAKDQAKKEARGKAKQAASQDGPGGKGNNKNKKCNSQGKPTGCTP